MVDFHPRPQTKPVSLRAALTGTYNTQQEVLVACYPPQTICHRILCQMRPGECGDAHHPRGALFSLYRLTWEKPSRTILKEQGGGAASQCCHPDENRRLTVPELKRVASFPDTFRRAGTYRDQWARIGNSVPPKLMEAIAFHIYEIFLAPSRVREGESW